MQGGTGAKVGWLGLVEFDVDRPRSRATDGHSVNATTRKTKNQAFARVVRETKRPDLSGRPHCKGVAIGVDIKAVLFGRTKAKFTTAARPESGHDTRRRLQWQSALFFFALGAERRIASRGRFLFLCRSALAAQETKINHPAKGPAPPECILYSFSFGTAHRSGCRRR